MSETGGNHNALIIGGTSGLGLEMARLFRKEGYVVWVTGRTDPKEKMIPFCNFDINHDVGTLSLKADRIIDLTRPIHLLVYAAGFLGKGLLDNFTYSQISAMINVGLIAPALLLQKILRMQGKLPGFIAVTSTSQWIPRKEEPVYAAVKAGLSMLAHSVSRDSRVEKTLVAGPAGMNTRFWRSAPRSDQNELLDPAWVAAKIWESYQKDFKYRLIRILRDPPRVESIEQE